MRFKITKAPKSRDFGAFVCLSRLRLVEITTVAAFLDGANISHNSCYEGVMVAVRAFTVGV